MQHRPSKNGSWRMLVLENRWWLGAGPRGKWVWRQYMPGLAREKLPPLYHIIAYLSIRGLVRQGLAHAIRLVTPDGNVAAEEYARFKVFEGYEDGINYQERCPIRWPRVWKVSGRRRCGST